LKFTVNWTALVNTSKTRESLPNRYSAHVSACVTGLQHSALYRFGRFAKTSVREVILVSVKVFRTALVQMYITTLTNVHEITCINRTTTHLLACKSYTSMLP